MYLVLSARMMPINGYYFTKEIPFKLFFELIKHSEFKSYIGHPINAQLLSRELGTKIPINRELVTPKSGGIVQKSEIMGNNAFTNLLTYFEI